MESTNLKSIARIKAGYPYRGRIEDTGGPVAVVQMRNVTTEGQIHWDELVKTELTGKRKPDWLTKDQILFVARGNHNFSVIIDDVPLQSLCAPHFFLIEIKNHKKIHPHFLNWWINEQPSQDYFKNSAEGSTTLSIRRGVLELLPVICPAMNIQQKIVELASSIQKERLVLKRLIEYRKNQLHIIAQNIYSKL